jgi:hypothetical protein
MHAWGIVPATHHNTNISAKGATQRLRFNQPFPRAYFWINADTPDSHPGPCKMQVFGRKFSHLDKNNGFRLKFSCRPHQVHLLDSQFSRLFWGEQPPFASFRGVGGGTSF